MKNQRGITLISLVITIVVLIILAGVAISMTLGENGIFNKAQEAKKMQAIATAKEQIGLEILEAQIEAMENNKELEQTEVEAIVAKYGVLQADGDTIILNDTEYEVSLREIYNEMAEEEGDETTELAQLKALLAQTTVTEDKMLKDYKAYKDGQLITGTIENYAGQTVEAITITESGENALITIPEEGYYDATSKISIPVSEMNSNLVQKSLTYHSAVNVKNSTTVNVPTACLNGSALVMQFNANNISSSLTINGTDATSYADYWNTTGNAEYSGYGNATFRYFVINLDGSTNSLAFSRDWNNSYCDVAVIFFEEQMGEVECLGVQYATNKTYTCEEGYQYITVGCIQSGYEGNLTASGKYIVSQSRYARYVGLISLTNYNIVLDVRTLLNKESGTFNINCGTHDTVFVLRYKL